MKLPIEIYGSPILRRKCGEEISEGAALQLIKNMYETLTAAGGIGLAAPQVSQLSRIFIIDTLDSDTADTKIRKGYINPEILDFSDETSYFNEGCLSIPGIWEDTLRPEKIWVRYMDESFSERHEEMTGIQARVFQHEYDHLQGILFIDHLSALRKKLIKSRLNKIRKSASYR